MENLLQRLVDFFSKKVDKQSITYNGKAITFSTIIPFEEDNNSLLKDVFYNVENLLNGKIEIEISKCKLLNSFIFFDENDFRRRFEEYKFDFDNSNLLVLGKENIKWQNETFSLEKAFYFNYYNYRNLLSYFLSQPDFTTFQDEAKNQFVIISSEKGVFNIGYDYLESRVDLLDDLLPVINVLKKSFEKIEFIQFFKEAVINGVYQNTEIKHRFFTMVKNLAIILSFAEKDYNIYILKFGFDKIKSKFKEERNKYFETLEKNIESVSKQVVSFPLTFAATAFASYQVKEKPWILILIGVAYSLYTFLAWKILDITSYNSSCLIEDVQKEENSIRSTYLLLYSDFENDFKKIREKISKLNNLIGWLRTILITLLLIFWGYVIFQATSKPQVAKIEPLNIVLDSASKLNIKVNVTRTDSSKRK